MLRYAITSRALYPGDEQEKQAALLDQAARWIEDGLDFIQFREKDLNAGAQAVLARKILQKIDLGRGNTKLLINTRSDIALATGAHGVHLSSTPGGLTPGQLRSFYAAAGGPVPLITVSCHTLADVRLACLNQADAILFAPVFEKLLTGEPALPGQGLGQLRAACLAASTTPVYALGGVTLQNAAACLETGASGIAGIRLFQSV